MAASASRPRLARADTATVFHALSDETRLAVLDLLRGGEQCVCDLQSAVGAAQSRLSFHLRVLKDAGLVTDRKAGRWSYYALNADRVADVAESLGELASDEPAGRAAPKLHVLQRAPRVATVATTRRRTTVGSEKKGCC